MNYIDILILIPLVWFGYKGFKNGLVMELVSLVSIIAGIYIAIRFSDWVGTLLNIEGEYSSLIAFAITFIAVLVGVYFLGKTVDILVKKLSLGFINRIGGLFLGITKTALIVGLLIFFWNKIDSKKLILKPEQRNRSLFFHPMENISHAVWPLLNNIDKHIKSV